MRLPWLKFFLIFAAVIPLSGCLNSEDLSGDLDAGRIPEILSILPASGQQAGGEIITITGRNFVDGATITLGSAVCSAISISSTHIVCVTDSHSPSTVDVMVENPSGRSTTFSSGYTYLRPFSLTAISPSAGSIAGGTAVLLTGIGFQVGAVVVIGSNICQSITVLSQTQLSCVVPAGAVGAVTVTMTNGDGQTGSLPNGFTYQSGPVVSSISPSAGPEQGGTSVVILGSGFKAGADVFFGAAQCNITSQTGSQIVCTTTVHQPGAVDVVVNNNDGQSVTSLSAFTYQATPTITSVVPVAGSVLGGTTIQVLGTNFQSGASVLLDGLNCSSVTFVSGGQLTCVTPAHVAAIVSVSVVNPDTLSATAASAYTYQAGPTVTSISPTAGPLAGGTPVTITGTGFLAGATVSLGGAACTGITVVSTAQITCTTSARTAATVSVDITNWDGQTGSLAAGFAYRPAPTVLTVSPNGGSPGGANTITVTGTGFIAGATVLLGGNSCTSVNVVSATQLTCVAPANAGGVVAISVQNPEGQSGSLAAAYTYQVAPTLTIVSPNQGPSSGGTAITLTGTGFLSGATVTIGATACNSTTVVSATQITCTTPSGTAGVASDVTVTNPDAQNVTLSGGFTHRGAPTVSSVSPSGGPPGGGTTITLTGTGFLAGATIEVDGSNCGSVVVASSTQLTCSTPAHANGLVAIEIVNPDAQSATLLGGFTYRPAPTVSSITPAIGSTSGANAVTITGTGFVAGATVSIDGVAATGVTIVSATQITATTPAHAAGTFDVVVTNTDTQTGTLAGSFTYSPLASPVISSISPVGGNLAGGTTLVLTGTGFASGATVTVGGNPCGSLVVTSATSITCVTPAGALGPAAVHLVAVDLQESTYNSFNYSPAPVVSSVTPTAGSVFGGTPISITGTGFLTGAQVFIGASPCTSVIVSSWTQINCTSSSSVPGEFEITVINNDYQWGSLAAAYTFQIGPSISTITPPRAVTAGGTTISITGSGFLAGATVMLGAFSCGTVNVVSGSLLTCITSAAVASTVTATVTNVDGQYGTKLNGFTFSNAPLVSTVTPAIGDPIGGTAVTLDGGSFIAGATVTFDGVAATNVVVVNSAQITCDTPAHAAGYTDVVVTNPNLLTGTKSNGFLYSLLSNPTVTSVAPDGGALAGGTNVVITGTGFVAGSFVTLGAGACNSVNVVSPTEIQCTTQSHSEGPVDVTVTLPDARQGTLASGFTYRGPPAIFSVYPSFGSTSGGNTVTVLGRKFLSGATILVDGNPCTLPSYTGQNKLTCFAPAGAGANRDVTVVNPDSQSATLTGGYTYGTVTYATASAISGIRNPQGFGDGASDVARVANPWGLTGDGTYYYVADLGNHTIRRVTIATGAVTTLAGSPGQSGCVNGTGSVARFNTPRNAALNGTTLYIADFGCNAIRAMDINTLAVTTVAGTLNGPAGHTNGTGAGVTFRNPLSVHMAGGMLYIVDFSNHTIRVMNPATFAVTDFAGSTANPGVCSSVDGIGAAARFCNPYALTDDGTYLYVADSWFHVIRRIEIATADVTTIAGLAGTSGFVNATGTAARFSTPTGVAHDGGRLFIVDNGNHAIREMDLGTGAVTTLAGGNGAGRVDGDPMWDLIRFNSPRGIYADTAGLVIADYDNHALRLVDPDSGVTSTIVGATDPTSLAGGSGTAVRFSNARGIAGDGTNLFVADLSNLVIRQVDPGTGTATVLAGSGISGVTDGSLLTARFSLPTGVAWDGAYLYVLDNAAVRKIDFDFGVVSTLAGNAGTAGYVDAVGTSARFSSPSGIATDGQYLYISDAGNRVIRRVDVETGTVSTLAGQGGVAGTADGSGVTARFTSPSHLTTDGTYLYLSDNHTIRQIHLSTANVTTLAGLAATASFLDGTGSAARFNTPTAITTDGMYLYIGDMTNNAIRRLDLANQAVITMIGGTGTRPIGDLDAALASAYVSEPRGMFQVKNKIYFTNSWGVRSIAP